jgi:DNA-binding XRE family transcriptional regulator
MRANRGQERDQRKTLGDLMEERREDLRLYWEDVAKAAGVTDQTLRDIRSGKSNPRALTRRGIEAALRWERGSIDAILAGGDPTPLSGNAVQSERAEPGSAQPAFDTPRSIPAPWIATALANEGIDPDALRPFLGLLRALGERSGYTLGETLIESGLASAADLALRSITPPPGETAVERYQAQLKRIKDDKNLSRGEKKDLAKSLEGLREALGLTQSK